ncbi:MAG: hypothetical protein R6U43_08185 [Candidatus Krumholzibacteriales bacterium]
MRRNRSGCRNIWIAVFGPSGKLVRALTGRRFSHDRHQVTWDGTDTAGRISGSWGKAISIYMLLHEVDMRIELV